MAGLRAIGAHGSSSVRRQRGSWCWNGIGEADMQTIGDVTAKLLRCLARDGIDERQRSLLSLAWCELQKHALPRAR